MYPTPLETGPKIDLLKRTVKRNRKEIEAKKNQIPTCGDNSFLQQREIAVQPVGVAPWRCQTLENSTCAPDRARPS